MSDNILLSSEFKEVLALQHPDIISIIKWVQEPAASLLFDSPIPLEDNSKKFLYTGNNNDGQQRALEKLADFMLSEKLAYDVVSTLRHCDIKYKPRETWGLFVDKVCVVDVNNMESAMILEECMEEFRTCPVQSIMPEGRQYFLASPLGQQGQRLAVKINKQDVSVVLTEVTRSNRVVLISPSKHIRWLRSPWSPECSTKGLPKLPPNFIFMLEKINVGSLSTPIVQPLNFSEVNIPPTKTYDKDKDNNSLSLADIEVICMSDVHVEPRYTTFTFDARGGNWSHMVAIEEFDCWDSEIVSYNDMKWHLGHKAHLCDPTRSKFTNIHTVRLNFNAYSRCRE